MRTAKNDCFACMLILERKRRGMKKTTACVLSLSLICSSAVGLTPARASAATYTFGNEYIVVKDFDTAVLDSTEIGSTGIKAQTEASNYNNVVVRDKNSENSGYYPYGSGLPDNGYYLFIGSGGNGDVKAVLTLPENIDQGSYVSINYAKPYSTNNGSINRSVGNKNTVTVGSDAIDIEGSSEFDRWYTAVVKADSDISDISVDLGKWSSIAISEISVLESADMLELTAADDTESLYIMDGAQVQYNASVYTSMITDDESGDIVMRGDADETAEVTYSVTDADGVSIDQNGLLTVSSEAQPGTITVTAEYEGAIKTLDLELKELGNADKVEITGDESVKPGSSLTLSAIPTAGGVMIPERSTIWSIEGESLGCSIDNGVLTVPENAETGNITVKAELAVEGAQQAAGISDEFIVTIIDESIMEETQVDGVFLKDGATDISSANGVDGVIINKRSASDGLSVVVKALGEKNVVLAETSADISSAVEGVSGVNTAMEFSGATSVKAYIKNSDGLVVSDIFRTDKGSYKNVPLVSDWLTGAKSGLGMGAGIIAPSGVPVGVDPELVDTSSLNVKYTYENYPEQTVDNVLWYKTGAYLKSANGANNSIYARDSADWEQQALPIGNGYMGGMLFGMPDKDQIQFNEETFWAAGYRGVQTEVPSNNINSQMSEGINGYMSVGNLFVDFDMPENAEIKNYYRDLNLDESVAHVRYEYDGTNYNREYFASYPKEVLVLRYTADTENALNFSVNPVSAHPGDVTVNNGEIKIVGRLKDSEPYSSGGNVAWSQESDLEYCTIIKVIADDGTVTDGYNKVDISGATGVTVLVAAATDYDPDRFVLNEDGSVDMSQTPYKSERGVAAAIEKAENRISGAAAMSYDELKAEHTADYRAQFDTVSFSLTDKDEVCQLPTNELQASYKSVVGVKTNSDGTTSVNYDESKYNALDKHLEELHYNYARYLMISSSRSTTMPANLQGKWCQSVAEIWGSCYCININMEMNYWFVGGANLLDSGKALIEWFNSQIPAGRVTAKNMYKVTPKSYKFENGVMTFTDSDSDEDDVFIMHTKQAIMGTTDMTGSTNIQSPGNTAWLMYNLWDLYQTSGDEELLRNELYPIMRKAANFYTQYLYTNMKKTTTDTETYPDGYYYTTWEGRSPEHGPTQTGVKYDLQLVAGMYDYVIEAAGILGVDEDKVAAWHEIRDHLETPVELGEDGQIKEWAQETTYNTDGNGNALGESVHRHISHLVGLYPGNLINRDTPELLEGAKIVLQKRGDDSTGWSCSNKFLLWARALDGDKALELFRYQLAQKTYANLFDFHEPFQIDGNFGSAAGVMELLMQSQTGDIYILPALPTEWDKGEISGIKAKNGAEISIRWSENKADEFVVKPVHDGDITIGYEKDNNAFMLNGEYIEFENGEYTIKNAEAGKEYVFTTTEAADPVSLSLTKTHVKAENAYKGVLAVAGYNADGSMSNIQIIDGYEADLVGFESCAKVRAFLWNDTKDMKPLCNAALAE